MAIIYTRNEERANTWTHAAGILIGLVACVYFLTLPIVLQDGLAILGILLYAFGVLSSYITSTAYHATAMDSPRREMLRKFDHSAIYCHIAGSYSPISLIGMREDMFWGWLLFIIVWACAIIGTSMSFYRLKEHSYLETCCFVGMGLLVLFTFKQVLNCIGWESMGWIIAEGVAFITGAVFYSFKNVPYMHTVFHVFVLLGSICHITALYVMLT